MMRQRPLVKKERVTHRATKRKSDTKPSRYSDDDVIIIEPNIPPKRARQVKTTTRRVAPKKQIKSRATKRGTTSKEDSDSSDDDVILLDEKPVNNVIRVKDVRSLRSKSGNTSKADLSDTDDNEDVYLDLTYKENGESSKATVERDLYDPGNDSESRSSSDSSPEENDESRKATVENDLFDPGSDSESSSSTSSSKPTAKRKRPAQIPSEKKRPTHIKRENLSKTKMPSKSLARAVHQTKDTRKPLLDIKDSKRPQRTNDEADVKPVWSDAEFLADKSNIQSNIAKNLVNLFESGNTIPFIARYRRDVTGDMSPEKLRETREHFEELCDLKTRMKSVVKNIEKIGELRQELRHSILASRTMEELEHIYAPFKPGGKRTLAEKAKELGLEEAAMALLTGTHVPDLTCLVDPSKKELNSLQLVEKGIMHIIAAVIGTDTELLTTMRELRKQGKFRIETKKMKTKTANLKVGIKGVPDESKYQNYFDYSSVITYLKPHQVLAINRGENQKVLSVKVLVPGYVENRLKDLCYKKWLKSALFNANRNRIVNEAINDAYNRLVQPLLVREIRADLKQMAEKASCEVFSTNLKHLLLAPPLKGKTILGIDPGFAKGCKLALTSTTGSLLEYGVIYPHTCKIRGEEFARMMLQKHNCNLIALGNGTACRETEQWLSNLIQNKYFSPLDVSYTIVNECGASIYSCSAEAKKEFPDLDPNIISAVSLARRVQEPLAELVKVEPQHLGVGMYQHDLKKKNLEESLSEVVSECVSFVGVDLNTASQCLLRRIAGLTDKRATEIITYREKNGSFTHRKQLIDIKGIGPRAFQQCSGFLRVGPTDLTEAVNFYKKPNTTKMDRTYIHPESYDIARKILAKLKLNEKDIGEQSFISTVKAQRSRLNIVAMCEELDCTPGTIRLILDTLSTPLNHDLRSECKVDPLFKKGVTSIDDIVCGDVLTGCVLNVTHFGCFVDIGVGTDGLIHVSNMNGLVLQIGNKVEVKVENIELHRKRISLRALRRLG